MRNAIVTALLLATLAACGDDGGSSDSGPRFVDNHDGTITDNQTGLMWEKKSAALGVHNVATYYTWSAQPGGTAPDGTVFTEFIATLNTPPCFAGYCDWRLPIIGELGSILPERCSPIESPCAADAFNSNCLPGCSEAECSCTFPWYYWSATTFADHPAQAFTIDFLDGIQSSFTKSAENSVVARAVRWD